MQNGTTQSKCLTKRVVDAENEADALRKQLSVIEEYGTREINAAIVLRQEVAGLRVEIEEKALRYLYLSIEVEQDKCGECYRLFADLYFGCPSEDVFGDGKSIRLGEWLHHDERSLNGVQDCQEHWERVGIALGIPVRLDAFWGSIL